MEEGWEKAQAVLAFELPTRGMRHPAVPVNRGQLGLVMFDVSR